MTRNRIKWVAGAVLGALLAFAGPAVAQTVVSGSYNSTLPVCTSGKPCPMQVDSSGRTLQAPVTGASASQVQGTAADGATVVGNPVLTGCYDGTNAQSVSCNASGQPVVVGAGTAGSAAGGVVTIQGVTSMTDVETAVQSFPDNEPFNLNQVGGTAYALGPAADTAALAVTPPTSGQSASEYLPCRLTDGTTLGAAGGQQAGSASLSVVPYSSPTAGTYMPARLSNGSAFIDVTAPLQVATTQGDTLDNTQQASDANAAQCIVVGGATSGKRPHLYSLSTICAGTGTATVTIRDSTTTTADSVSSACAGGTIIFSTSVAGSRTITLFGTPITGATASRMGVSTSACGGTDASTVGALGAEY